MYFWIIICSLTLRKKYMKFNFFLLVFCLLILGQFDVVYGKPRNLFHKKESFVPLKEWTRVYLASFPRSGNHWVRYLVEEATHVATSSVYCDPDPQHLLKPFPWGGYCCDHGYEGNCRYPSPDDCVVVKTHFPSRNKPSEFDKLPHIKCIRIVRNPVDCIYSKYVRYVENNHLELALKVPTEFVLKSIEQWSRFQHHWNKQKKVVTIRYEDMLKDPKKKLKKILKYITSEVTQEDIERSVEKYPPQGYELKHLDKFNASDLELMEGELSDLLKQFGYTVL